jgi:lipid A disaccharide synthetase
MMDNRHPKTHTHIFSWHNTVTTLVKNALHFGITCIDSRHTPKKHFTICDTTNVMVETVFIEAFLKQVPMVVHYS